MACDLHQPARSKQKEHAREQTAQDEEKQERGTVARTDMYIQSKASGRAAVACELHQPARSK